MTVIVTKDAINLREKLSELDKETGIKGEELMRADTSAEAREALQLDQQLFTDFESTGIDDNATSTALTINSSENIGIGIAIPIFKLDVHSSSAVTAAFSRDGTDGDALQIFNGSTYGTKSLGLGGVGNNGIITNQYGNIQLAPSGTTRTTVSSTGIEVTGNIEVSGGVYLGGTAAANLLDDYEEGIWTPLLVPLNGAFTSQTIINYLTDKPRYTKIGNLVMVSVLFTTYELTKGTGSGNVYLGGLPFTVYTSSAATISYAHDFLGDNPSSGSVFYQSDKILLQYRTTPNGEDVNLQVSDLGTTDGSNTFQLTLVYRTQE